MRAKDTIRARFFFDVVADNPLPESNSNVIRELKFGGYRRMSREQHRL